MKLLYLDCSSGASGDMILGALLDAGASEAEIRRALDALALDGWSLGVSEVTRAGLRAARAAVETNEERRYGYKDIERIISGAPLDDAVRNSALEIFRRLAEAEASVHGQSIGDVHFHEVGALDAIVDVVGASAALADLAPDRIACSAIRTGTGTAMTAHGTIPVPGPAVTALLPGATLIIEGEGELLTPTGAAIIASCADDFGAPPPFVLRAVGYGAGSRDTEAPNVLRVMIGEVDESSAPAEHLLIETNLDDMIPELVPHVIERSIAVGAQDAWTSPIIMKKGRPALTLSVLTTRSRLDAVLDVVYSETSTLGVRIREVAKDELERTWTTVEVEGYEVKVKLGLRGGRVVTASPEFEDASKVAHITGLPLKEIYRRAAAGLDPPSLG